MAYGIHTHIIPLIPTIYPYFFLIICIFLQIYHPLLVSSGFIAISIQRPRRPKDCRVAKLVPVLVAVKPMERAAGTCRGQIQFPVEHGVFTGDAEYEPGERMEQWIQVQHEARGSKLSKLSHQDFVEHGRIDSECSRRGRGTAKKASLGFGPSEAQLVK